MKKIATYFLIYLQIIILLILSFLLLGSYTLKHSILVIAGLIIFSAYIVLKQDSHKPLLWRAEPASKYIAFIIAISITVIITFQIRPTQDQWLLVQIAQEIRNYNFSAFYNGGYLFRYPFQSGLVLFYYVLSFVFGESNYIALQMINLIASIYMLYILNCFAKTIIKGKYNITDRLYLAFLVCYPFYIYILYIYGTIIGFSLGIGALYYLNLYKNYGKRKDAIISILTLTLSIALKPNGKIILVAAIIYILYWWIQKEMYIKKVFGLITSYFAVGFLCNQLIALGVYLITGLSLGKGMPMLGWIAMGLSEGGEAPGSYSGFVVNAFIKSGYDYHMTSQYALQEIYSRLYYFSTNLKDAIRFFIDKTLYQWGDTAFNADKILNYGNIIHESSLFNQLIRSSFVSFFSKSYEVIVLTGNVFFLWLKRKEIHIEDMMLAVVFIGGFIFHLFWEASPSYTVTYFFLLIPYAVIGYKELVLQVNDYSIRKLKISLNEKHVIKWLRKMMLITLVFLILCGSYTNADLKIPLLENGYYTIECDNNAGECLTLWQDEVQLERSSSEKNITVSKNKENGLYQIRFYPSGKLLAINDEGNLIGYIDSIVNMEYVEETGVQYEWNIIKNQENGYYIASEDMAVTYNKENGRITLERLNNSSNQSWIFIKNN